MLNPGAHLGAHRRVRRGAHRGVRTTELPWRQVYVVLPVAALIAVGVALVAPADDVKGVTGSKDSPAVVVPAAAFTLAHVVPDPVAAETQKAPEREPSKTGAASPTTRTAKTANQQPAPHSTSPTGQGPRVTSAAPTTTATSSPPPSSPPPSSPPPSEAPPRPTLPILF
jgi:serine/threonine-protein kinase